MKPSSHQHLQSIEDVKAHEIFHCIGCDRQPTCIIFWLLRLEMETQVVGNVAILRNPKLGFKSS